MGTVPTPHNGAAKGDIAKTVFMPGDPLRAKYIAETYLTNVECVTTVRNMLGFTGDYKGKRITVMGAGMGMPSIGIYTYELYNFYDVDQIIRIGSAGALQENVELMSIVVAVGACTDSNYASQFQLPGTFAPTATFDLLRKAVDIAKDKNLPIHVGNILSTDVFYNPSVSANELWRKMGVLAVDMETAALYMNAAYAGKKALCLLTISDQLYKNQYLSADERQLGFKNMIELALELS